MAFVLVRERYGMKTRNLRTGTRDLEIQDDEVLRSPESNTLFYIQHTVGGQKVTHFWYH